MLTLYQKAIAYIKFLIVKLYTQIPPTPLKRGTSEAPLLRGVGGIECRIFRFFSLVDKV
jgi:hypothetical protein